jgi:DNA repair protein RecO (recombination protein O)
VDERSTGIILRTRPLTETSVIVHWLTIDLGRITTVAKGGRRPRSPFHGKLDLFYEADFSFARSRKSELHTLREVVLRDAHSKLREDFHRIQQASYCAAFIEQATEVETPLPEVHEMFTSVVQHLTERAPSPNTMFAFELKMLGELGLNPNLSDTHLQPGTRELARALAESDWNMIARLKLSEAQETELRQFLHGFLIYHLGKLPRGRAAALGGSRIQ